MKLRLLYFARLREALGTEREDVTVLTLYPGRWQDVPRQYPGRTVFITRPLDDLRAEYDLLPFRNLWRLSTRVD